MKKFFSLIIALAMFPSPVSAAPALGIHLLDPNELPQAMDLAQNGAVTVVLRSDDHNLKKWQQFFDTASSHNILPIIRLATTMEAGGWRRPTTRDLVHHVTFLNFLRWHRDSLPIVVFNEPNHAAEWGGAVDPQGYGEILDLSLDLFQHQRKAYIVAPAGLDAAAPNSIATMDSFTFLNQVFASRPDLADKIDAWVSHSYPNPGFVGSPLSSGKASIRGFEAELAYLARYTGRSLPVYITETGWRSTPATTSRLPDYYTTAVKQIWNSDRIVAITPFVFSANAGPFAEFSFTYPDGSPTPHYLTWKSLLSAHP